MTAPEPVHLTTEELAERYHTTPNNIRVKRSRGLIPKGFRSGKDHLTPLARIEAWEQSRLVRPA